VRLGPLRPGGRRQPPPADPVAVVLASVGLPFSQQALRAAAQAADGGRVAVVSIARLHGFALGMPNPGLLPTAQERAAATQVVSDAARQLDGWGVPNDCQVVITRNPAGSIARVARRRQARLVALQAGRLPRWRALVEGDPVRALRRRTRGRCVVTSWQD
jgi:hypothetical protein